MHDLYVPMLDEGELIESVVDSGRWHDLGTPQRFLEAVIDWARAGWPERLWRRSWISPEAAWGRAPRSALGDRAGAQVGEGARVERSVLLPGARVGKGSVVRESILGFGAAVPARHLGRAPDRHAAGGGLHPGARRLGGGRLGLHAVRTRWRRLNAWRCLSSCGIPGLFREPPEMLAGRKRFPTSRLRLGRDPDGLDRVRSWRAPRRRSGELELRELPDETIRGTIGLGLRETIEILCPGGGDEMFGRILECYRKHWPPTYRDLPVLFDGVGEMLAGSGGGRLSAGGRHRQEPPRARPCPRARRGSRQLFHATRTVDEAFSKPHPQMLLDILDELGVAPRDAVMIGDTTYDLEMARSAGTASVGVCTGAHCREELESFGPLACLDEVVELAGVAGRGPR